MNLPWWACALSAWVVVGVLGLNRVDLSIKVLGVVVTAEFLVVVVYDVIGLGAAPEGITADGLLPGQLFATGVGAALVFSIAAFMGFESGAIYNEEVKDPRTTAGRATLIAIVLIGAFYAFSAWAMTMAEGPGNVVEQAQLHGPDLMFVFLAQHVPIWFVDLANILFMTSLVAALLAFHNIVARYFFALGRERILPAAVARTSKRTGAPIAGSMTQSVLALVVIGVFALAEPPDAGPLYPVVTLFTWLTNMGAFGLVLLMAMTSLAVTSFLRNFAGEYSVWTRLIAPGLAAAGLIGLFVLVIVNFSVLIGATGPNVLTWLLPAIVVLPGAFGTAWA
ncbi:APC family permease [Kocuria palustris]|uniref:APC family permease n=1 Tax=Kocuria palustris TaxID=71999 RepID=UPI0021B4CE68|nr:APC family permease [Kocuria palustris]